MRIERPVGLFQRDGIGALSASRQNRVQIAPEAFQHVRNLAAYLLNVVEMRSPRGFRVAITLNVAVAESLPGALAFDQEVIFEPIDDPSRQSGGYFRFAREQPDVGHQQLKTAVLHRAVGEKALRTALEAVEQVSQALECLLAGTLGGEI